jgi:hypothetical protein
MISEQCTGNTVEGAWIRTIAVSDVTRNHEYNSTEIPAQPRYSLTRNKLNNALLKAIRGKCKVVPVRAMNAYTGSRGIAPLILNLGTRSVVNFTLRRLYPPGKESRYPFNRRLGEPQSRSGLLEKNKSPVPSRIRNCSTVTKPTTRLRLPEVINRSAEIFHSESRIEHDPSKRKCQFFLSTTGMLVKLGEGQ